MREDVVGDTAHTRGCRLSAASQEKNERLLNLGTGHAFFAVLFEDLQVAQSVS